MSEMDKVLDWLDKRLYRVEQMISNPSSVVSPGGSPRFEQVYIGPSGQTVIINAVVPGAPTNLAISTGTFYNVIFLDITWNAPTSNTTEVVDYEVEIAKKIGGVYQLARIERVVATNFRFEPVEPDTTYGVRVYALNRSSQRGAATAWVDITTGRDATIPAQVTGLEVTPGQRSLTLTWNEVNDVDVKNGNGLYQVQIASDSGFTTVLRTKFAGGEITAFTDLAAATMYWARVRAVDSSGNAGPYTAGVSASTKGYIGTRNILKNGNFQNANLKEDWHPGIEWATKQDTPDSFRYAFAATTRTAVGWNALLQIFTPRPGEKLSFRGEMNLSANARQSHIKVDFWSDMAMTQSLGGIQFVGGTDGPVSWKEYVSEGAFTIPANAVIGQFVLMGGWSSDGAPAYTSMRNIELVYGDTIAHTTNEPVIQASSANPVVNGGMERIHPTVADTPEGWTVTAGPVNASDGWYRATNIKASGEASFRCTTPFAADRHSHQDIEFAKGRWTVSWKCKRDNVLSSGGAGSGVNIDGVSGGAITSVDRIPGVSGSVSGTDVMFTGTNEWRREWITFDVDSDGTIARFYLQQGYAGAVTGVTWWDDIEISRGSDNPDRLVVPELHAAAVRFGVMKGDRIEVNTLDVAKLKAGTALVSKELVIGAGGQFKVGNPPTTGMYINDQGISLYSGGSRKVFLDAVTGSATFTGSISGSAISGGTIDGGIITGGSVRTAASGNRIVLGPNNWNFNSVGLFSGIAGEEGGGVGQGPGKLLVVQSTGWDGVNRSLVALHPSRTGGTLGHPSIELWGGGADDSARIKIGSNQIELISQNNDISLRSNYVNFNYNMFIGALWSDAGLHRSVGTLQFAAGAHRFTDLGNVSLVFINANGVYADVGWFRSYGNRGLYNETYGQGWLFQTGSFIANVTNTGGIIGRSTNQGGGWSTASVRAEGDATYPGYGWHVPGGNASHLYMNGTSLYWKHHTGADQEVWGKFMNTSFRDSKRDIVAMSEEDGLTKIRQLKPIKFRQLPDPEVAAKWDNEIAKTRAKTPRRKIYTLDGETLTETDPRVQNYKRLSVAERNKVPSNKRIHESNDPQDHRWDNLTEAQITHMQQQRDRVTVGLIAEDIVNVFPEVVGFNEKGEPRGIQYQLLTAPLILAVQELEQRLVAAESEIATLKTT